MDLRCNKKLQYRSYVDIFCGKVCQPCNLCCRKVDDLNRNDYKSLSNNQQEKCISTETSCPSTSSCPPTSAPDCSVAAVISLSTNIICFIYILCYIFLKSECRFFRKTRGKESHQNFNKPEMIQDEPNDTG